MDAGVILEYFAPLRARLDRQNAGQLVGCEQGAQTNRGWRGGDAIPPPPPFRAVSAGGRLA